MSDSADSKPSPASAVPSPETAKGGGIGGKFGLGQREGERVFERPWFKQWALPLLILAFLLISLQYLRADLWFDEVLTLRDYGHAPRLGKVFTTYNVANNHILYSALLWVWLHVRDAQTEEMLRFPGLLMGVLTLWLMFSQGRVLLDRAAGFFLAFLMAFSPVYLAFYGQMRGYGVSILLATLATFGAMTLLTEHRRRGLWMFAVGALLLPMAVPSNVLVAGSLWLYVAVVAGQRRKLVELSGHLLVAGLCVVGGMAIYLPILPKLMRVMEKTQGWDSGGLVAGHWLATLAAHVGVFMLACYGMGVAWKRGEGKPTSGATGRKSGGGQGLAPGETPDGSPLYASLPILGLCCLVPLLAFALWRAPFPRSLIAYLAPLTVAAMCLFRREFVVRNTYFLLLLFFILCNTLVAYRLTEFTTGERLRAGEMPQNLLQQFYSRSREVSSLVAELRGQDLPPQTRILVDFNLYPGMDVYWGNPEPGTPQLECLGGSGKFGLSMPTEQFRWLPQLVVCYNGGRARRLYREAFGFEPVFEPLSLGGGLQVFQVLPPGSTGSGMPRPGPGGPGGPLMPRPGPGGPLGPGPGGPGGPGSAPPQTDLPGAKAI